MIYQNSKSAALIDDNNIIIKKSLMPYKTKEEKHKIPESLLNRVGMYETTEKLLKQMAGKIDKEEMKKYVKTFKREMQDFISKFYSVFTHHFSSQNLSLR